jgi:hypothetical protein
MNGRLHDWLGMNEVPVFQFTLHSRHLDSPAGTSVPHFRFYRTYGLLTRYVSPYAKGLLVGRIGR